MPLLHWRSEELLLATRRLYRASAPNGAISCVRSGKKQLIVGRKKSWPEVTKALPFTVSSQGPFFVEFTTVLARTPNGSLGLGLMDAEKASWPGDESPFDWSRGRGSEDSFAVSFSPADGDVFCTCAKGSAVELQDLDSHLPSGQYSCGQKMYRGALKWPTLGSAQVEWNAPIHCGIFIEDGNLMFWRLMGDMWHSSGVICRNLPERVRPCVFMFSFLGYANVNFVNVWHGAPAVCKCCDSRYHGTVDGWKPFPCADP